MLCLISKSPGECVEHVTGASDKPFQHVHGGCINKHKLRLGFAMSMLLTDHNDKEVTLFKSMANSRP